MDKKKFFQKDVNSLRVQCFSAKIFLRTSYDDSLARVFYHTFVVCCYGTRFIILVTRWMLHGQEKFSQKDANLLWVWCFSVKIFYKLLTMILWLGYFIIPLLFAAMVLLNFDHKMNAAWTRKVFTKGCKFIVSLMFFCQNIFMNFLRSFFG